MKVTAVIAAFLGVVVLALVLLEVGTSSAAGKKMPATQILQKLPLRSENREGYDRDAFRHWSDLDGNGCDAREDVLRQENLRPQGATCWDQRGRWFSVYDGVRTTDPSSFDVDHVVPLAEAWDSGARNWSERRREAYANDLWKPALRAVSASSNRSKSDSDPAEWMPPRKGFHCRYLMDWVLIKYRWRLSVDHSERRALSGVLRNCSLRAPLPARP